MPPCAGAGMGGVGYSPLAGDSAEADLAAKEKRLRELPALIRAAQADLDKRFCIREQGLMFEKCRQLEIGTS